MKIAITGHSKGIGRALYDKLANNHIVEGYSRSNGYDISTKQNIIIRSAKDCDVFINNAYKGYKQVDLLNAFFEMWKYNPDKTIVNISSLSKYPGLSSNISGYSAQKAALSHQAFLLMFKTDRKCRMINVNPGYVRTDMVSHVSEDTPMLTPDEVAECIVWAIQQPQHIEIGELSLWSP